MSTTTFRLTRTLNRPGRVGNTKHLLLTQLRSDARNAPRYLVRYAVIVLAVFGVLSIIDAHGDGQIPVFVSLLPTTGINPARSSAAECAAENVGREARWQGLAAPLKILDKVNPEIGRWVRQRNASGRLVFSNADLQSADQCRALAKYDVLSGKLALNRQLFAEHDGDIAVILAHEYRHSRQSYAKLARYALSFLFDRHGDASIVENDAEIYEREAKNAIFGQ